MGRACAATAGRAPRARTSAAARRSPARVAPRDALEHDLEPFLERLLAVGPASGVPSGRGAGTARGRSPGTGGAPSPRRTSTRAPRART